MFIYIFFFYHCREYDQMNTADIKYLEQSNMEIKIQCTVCKYNCLSIHWFNNQLVFCDYFWGKFDRCLWWVKYECECSNGHECVMPMWFTFAYEFMVTMN